MSEMQKMSVKQVSGLEYDGVTVDEVLADGERIKELRFSIKENRGLIGWWKTLVVKEGMYGGLEVYMEKPADPKWLLEGNVAGLVEICEEFDTEEEAITKKNEYLEKVNPDIEFTISEQEQNECLF